MQTFQSAQRFVSTRVLATRQGTVLLGVGAALLAGLVLLVYLNRYRESVSASNEPITVLVAKRLIEKGTPGDAVGLKQYFQVSTTPRDHVKVGALSDPAALRGTVAAADVLPGQQLTAADFVPSYTGGVGASLIDSQRAISFPVDGARGLAGTLLPGDRVDVYAGFEVGGRPVTKLIMQDLYVLSPPIAGAGGGIGGGGGGSNVLVRVTSGQAAKLIFTSENGKLWLVLRPRVDAKPVKPKLVTTDRVLGG